MCHVRRFFLVERSTPPELRVVHRVVRAIVRDVPEQTPANAKRARATASRRDGVERQPRGVYDWRGRRGGNTNRHLSAGSLVMTPVRDEMRDDAESTARRAVKREPVERVLQKPPKEPSDREGEDGGDELRRAVVRSRTTMTASCSTRDRIHSGRPSANLTLHPRVRLRTGR